MNTRNVVVIGGGLAGITAAISLREAGIGVTLLEARPWLGGATCSFSRGGLMIDNGQTIGIRILCKADVGPAIGRLMLRATPSVRPISRALTPSCASLNICRICRMVSSLRAGIPLSPSHRGAECRRC